MCRNIRVLMHFEPPTTEEEVHDAALQYVRKVSGERAPKEIDREAFDRAVEDIAASTRVLLATMHPRGEARTREKEREKAKARWAARVRTS